MDIIQLFTLLVNRDPAAAAFITERISQEETDKIAAIQYDETPAVFPNTEAGRKALADETFGAMKNYLRKNENLEFVADVAFQDGTVRSDFRKKANAATNKEFKSVYGESAVQLA
jgi:hypothetical protein